MKQLVPSDALTLDVERDAVVFPISRPGTIVADGKTARLRDDEGHPTWAKK